MAPRSCSGWQGDAAAGAAGRSRWCGLRSSQWGHWVRWYAAPRQIEWSGLQGRAFCGSRLGTQRGNAWAGGWWYLWTEGGVRGMGTGGARMLVGVCAVPVVSMCAVPVLCSVDGV